MRAYTGTCTHMSLLRGPGYSLLRYGSHVGLFGCSILSRSLARKACPTTRSVEASRFLAFLDELIAGSLFLNQPRIASIFQVEVLFGTKTQTWKVQHDVTLIPCASYKALTAKSGCPLRSCNYTASRGRKTKRRINQEVDS